MGKKIEERFDDKDDFDENIAWYDEDVWLV